MTISLIMTKQGNQLDASVRQKAFTFLQKITTDDTASGLHIEAIKGARDHGCAPDELTSSIVRCCSS